MKTTFKQLLDHLRVPDTFTVGDMADIVKTTKLLLTTGEPPVITYTVDEDGQYHVQRNVLMTVLALHSLNMESECFYGGPTLGEH